MNVNNSKIADRRTTLSYAKADFNKMRKKMRGTDWPEELRGKNVNETWYCIKAHIVGLIDMHIPKKKDKEQIRAKMV